MATIITNNYRTKNATEFINNFGTGSTYLFVGKSDPWSIDMTDPVDGVVVNPVDTQADLNNAYSNMMFMKNITTADVAPVIPKNVWTTGTIYSPWDNGDPNIFSKEFYIINSLNEIFKCVGINPITNDPTNLGIINGSTIEPLSTTPVTTDLVFETADGYQWKFLYSISAGDVTKFMGTVVPFIPINPSSALVPEISTIGAIHNIIIDAPGLSYVVGDLLTIKGDGTLFTAVINTVDITTGAITSVSITNKGTGYTRSDNIFITNSISGPTTGSGAILRPIISPLAGHGSDLIKELGSFYVCIATLFPTDGTGSFVTGNDFRQIGIIKDPLNAAGTPVPFIGSNISLLDEMTFPNPLIPPTVNDVISVQATGAIAYIDSIVVNGATTTIKFHQNDKTGFIPFVPGDILSSATPVSQGTPLVFVTLLDTNPIPVNITIVTVIQKLTRLSGQILTLENRTALSRSILQTETVKVILEF